MRKLLVLFIVVVSVLGTSPGYADVRSTTDWGTRNENETGLTVGIVFNSELWTGGRTPFAPATLSRIGAASKRAPEPGLHFELMGPGDLGCTLHLRW